MVDQQKEFGYPPKLCIFTGEYHYGADGYYKANRNKRKFRAPVYRAPDGSIVVDATQKEYVDRPSDLLNW